MPADNIERAIKKGTGELEGTTISELTYEGYGPGGIALLVEVATDNKNRTVAEVRHIFSRHSGNMGESGSVAYARLRPASRPRSGRRASQGPADREHAADPHLRHADGTRVFTNVPLSTRDPRLAAGGHP